MTQAAIQSNELRSRRIRPLKAYRHFRNLMADKEDTTQVFYIVEALDGGNLERDFKRFMKTPAGRARLKQRRNLVPLLDDHDTIKKLPEGTVGRAYVDFMETQGLSAQGLVDEYASYGKKLEDFYAPDIAWYGNRRRDVHDLMHIMTGYSRDALGEACVLNFTQSQHGGLGIYFIAHGAALEVRKQAPKGTPAWKAVREAKKHGALADIIIQEDIMALLAEPLEAAQRRMNIKPATTYHQTHEFLRNHGVDPFGVIGADQAASEAAAAA